MMDAEIHTEARSGCNTERQEKVENLFRLSWALGKTYPLQPRTVVG